jgi:hypothetical protein
MIRYRQLSPPEFPQLEPIFKQYNKSFSPLSFLTVFVAEDDNGNIVGMLPVQYVAHIEPLWIDDKHRGKVSWRKLEQMADELFSKIPGSQYFAFAPEDTPAKEMVKIAGLKRLPWLVFTKEF